MKHSLLGFFLLFDRFEEVDANLIAIDPGELAAPICFSHGRKHQEKLLHGKALNRTVDRKSSAGIRHILHCAGPLPSPVDRHHVRGKSPLKYDTMCFALFHLNQSSSWKMQLKNPSDLRRVPYALPSRKLWEHGRDCENRNIRWLRNFARPVGLPRRHFESPAAIYIPRGASRQPQLPEDQINQGEFSLRL
jgi:hypothetical protein